MDISSFDRLDRRVPVRPPLPMPPHASTRRVSIKNNKAIGEAVAASASTTMSPSAPQPPVPVPPQKRRPSENGGKPSAKRHKQSSVSATTTKATTTDTDMPVAEATASRPADKEETIPVVPVKKPKGRWAKKYLEEQQKQQQQQQQQLKQQQQELEESEAASPPTAPGSPPSQPFVSSATASSPLADTSAGSKPERRVLPSRRAMLRDHGLLTLEKSLADLSALPPTPAEEYILYLTSDKTRLDDTVYDPYRVPPSTYGGLPKDPSHPTRQQSSAPPAKSLGSIQQQFIEIPVYRTCSISQFLQEQKKREMKLLSATLAKEEAEAEIEAKAAAEALKAARTFTSSSKKGAAASKAAELEAAQQAVLAARPVSTRQRHKEILQNQAKMTTNIVLAGMSGAGAAGGAGKTGGSHAGHHQPSTSSRRSTVATTTTSTILSSMSAEEEDIRDEAYERRHLKHEKAEKKIKNREKEKLQHAMYQQQLVVERIRHADINRLVPISVLRTLHLKQTSSGTSSQENSVSTPGGNDTSLPSSPAPHSPMPHVTQHPSSASSQQPHSSEGTDHGTTGGGEPLSLAEAKVLQDEYYRRILREAEENLRRYEILNLGDTNNYSLNTLLSKSSPYTRTRSRLAWMNEQMRKDENESSDEGKSGGTESDEEEEEDTAMEEKDGTTTRRYRRRTARAGSTTRAPKPSGGRSQSSRIRARATDNDNVDSDNDNDHDGDETSSQQVPKRRGRGRPRTRGDKDQQEEEEVEEEEEEQGEDVKAGKTTVRKRSRSSASSTTEQSRRRRRDERGVGQQRKESSASTIAKATKKPAVTEEPPRPPQPITTFLRPDLNLARGERTSSRVALAFGHKVPSVDKRDFELPLAEDQFGTLIKQRMAEKGYNDVLQVPVWQPKNKKAIDGEASKAIKARPTTVGSRTVEARKPSATIGTKNGGTAAAAAAPKAPKAPTSTPRARRVGTGTAPASSSRKASNSRSTPSKASTSLHTSTRGTSAAAASSAATRAKTKTAVSTTNMAATGPAPALSTSTTRTGAPTTSSPTGHYAPGIGFVPGTNSLRSKETGLDTSNPLLSITQRALSAIQNVSHGAAGSPTGGPLPSDIILDPVVASSFPASSLSSPATASKGAMEVSSPTSSGASTPASTNSTVTLTPSSLAPATFP